MAAQSLLRLLRHSHTHTHRRGRQKQFRSRYLKEEEMSVSRRISRLSHQDKILSSLLSPLITSLYHSAAFFCLSFHHSFFLFLLLSSSNVSFSSVPPFLLSASSVKYFPPITPSFPPLSLLSCLSLCEISLFLLLPQRDAVDVGPGSFFLLHGLSADDKWLGAA